MHSNLPKASRQDAVALVPAAPEVEAEPSDAERVAEKLDSIAKGALAHARRIGRRDVVQTLTGMAGAIEAQADILRMCEHLSRGVAPSPVAAAEPAGEAVAKSMSGADDMAAVDPEYATAWSRIATFMALGAHPSRIAAETMWAIREQRAAQPAPAALDRDRVTTEIEAVLRRVVAVESAGGDATHLHMRDGLLGGEPNEWRVPDLARHLADRITGTEGGGAE